MSELIKVRLTLKKECQHDNCTPEGNFIYTFTYFGEKKEVLHKVVEYYCQDIEQARNSFLPEEINEVIIKREVHPGLTMYTH